MKIAVVGAGIFGLTIARELAAAGLEVDVLEASDRPMRYASRVNQARLHTGMHYPRDFKTAREAFADFSEFRRFYPLVFSDIEQYYALAPDSKTNWFDFLEHARDLGLPFEEVEPELFLKTGRAQGMIKVPEATIDFPAFTKTLLGSLRDMSNVRLRLNSEVEELRDFGHVETVIGGIPESFDCVVITSYAMSQKFKSLIDDSVPSIRSQVTEVLLGRFHGLENTGITIMDGPYWSTMPYGFSGLHSLTSVIFTPLIETVGEKLECQSKHGTCGKNALADCNSCQFRPMSQASRTMHQASEDILDKYYFEYSESMFTVKSLLSSEESNISAARPSSVWSSSSGAVHLVHSGKIGSALSLARSLALKISAARS
jgi:hypothetical protein